MTDDKRTPRSEDRDSAATPPSPPRSSATARPGELGGPKGPEPTRYGDWERDGRCVDF